MSLVVKFLLITVVWFFSWSETYAWETLTEMLEEARQADEKDIARLGTNLETKEMVLTMLLREKPGESSSIGDFYKREAMLLISRHIEFYGKGTNVITSWASIAYSTLGTEDVRSCLIGFVALADIRGLPTFKETLNKLLAGVEKPDDLESLTDRFSVLKVSS